MELVGGLVSSACWKIGLPLAGYLRASLLVKKSEKLSMIFVLDFRTTFDTTTSN